eukprot:437923-Hanusia_phi.AAC.7
MAGSYATRFNNGTRALRATLALTSSSLNFHYCPSDCSPACQTESPKSRASLASWSAMLFCARGIHVASKLLKCYSRLWKPKEKVEMSRVRALRYVATRNMGRPLPGELLDDFDGFCMQLLERRFFDLRARDITTH